MGKSIHFLRSDLSGSQNLASAALTYTTTFARKFKLEEVVIHASVVITETVTITRDSAKGADYDHVLAKRSMVAEQDFIFRPSGECNFHSGDALKIQCTNANTTGVVYYLIKMSEM